VLTVINADVAVDVEEAHRLSPLGDASLRQRFSEIHRPAHRGQLLQLAPQRLDLWRAVQAKHLP